MTTMQRKALIRESLNLAKLCGTPRWLVRASLRRILAMDNDNRRALRSLVRLALRDGVFTIR
jgi:hypothetical protein